MSRLILHTATALAAARGVAHLFATRGVFAGFGDLGADNRRIIAMQWIVEGVALVTSASFVAVTTAVQSDGTLADAIYAVASGTLIVLAVVSVFTGFRIAFLPFRLCPFIFGASAALICWGAWL